MDVVEKRTQEVNEGAKPHIYIKLGFNEEECNKTVSSLNTLLANYHIHYQKLRNYHWNVTGADFFDIHEKFEEQYNDVKVAIDDIAERIRVFGEKPMSTLKEYLEHSEIKETTNELSADEMVKEILNDYEILLTYMFKVVRACLESGDFATEEMVKSFIKKIEKNHWMFTSFASE
ncbi:MAG: Dps family protein [Thermonemataceae bacterium]